VAATGLAAMLGWWLGLPLLTSVLPGWPSQKPATALMGMLIGAALALLASRDGPGWARAAGKASAGAAGALALATLVELGLGFELGIDRLLAGRSVGRPVARTAATFLLAAAALLSLDRVTVRGRSPAQILAALAGSIPLLALLGYAFRFPALHTPMIAVPTSGMAFQTAAAMVILASGILVSRPAVGPMAALTAAHAGGVAARRLLLGLLAFVPVALLVLAGERLGRYGEPAMVALLVFLALAEGAALILLTALRLGDYDLHQKAAEALLRQSEQRLRELIGKAPDGIFIADLEGRCTDVNEAGCRLLGLPREEIVGKTTMDFIAPEDVPRLWRNRDELMGGATVVSEWALRHRDGSYVPTEVSASILPDGRWQGFVRDITDRKRAEAELAEAR